jgi:xanthine/CO dehydrogenase XdhC/CoxF family maturation factor
MLSGRAAAIATVVESGNTDLVRGATLIRTSDGNRSWGLADAAAERIAAACDDVLKSGLPEYSSEDQGARVLYAPLQPVPRLLLLGAGLDAIPVVNLASDLGWIVTVADHRPAYTARPEFGRAQEVRLVEPPMLGTSIDLDVYDAIVVMSHHLATDQTYLGHVADARAIYIGVLGPPARKQRLLEALGERGDALHARLKGPVGLDIGADSPEAIALSIVAELQAAFARGKVRQ